MPDSPRASEQRFRRFTERDESILQWQYTLGYVSDVTRAAYRWAFRGGTRILDVGCGAGEAALWADGADYVGVDRSEPWIRRGAAATDRRLAVADIMHLPFAAGCFDRVVCAGMLHHLSADQIRPALGEMARVLASGGQIALMEPNPWNPFARLFAYLRPAERGILYVSPARLRSLIAQVPEVKLEGLTFEHSSFVGMHLTFLLRRWPRLCSRGMARLFWLLHEMGQWIFPRSIRARTFCRLAKVDGVAGAPRL